MYLGNEFASQQAYMSCLQGMLLASPGVGLELALGQRGQVSALMKEERGRIK